MSTKGEIPITFCHYCCYAMPIALHWCRQCGELMDAGHKAIVRAKETKS